MSTTSETSVTRSLSSEQRACLIELARRSLQIPSQALNLTRYQSDPVAYARDILKVSPWERQAEIMRAVADERRVTVRACHSSGKTFGAACLVQWFTRCFDPAL